MSIKKRRVASLMNDMIKNIYDKIPKSQCLNGCYKCCTNMIQYTPSELKAMGGYEYNGKCSHLKDGKCSIYDKRPLYAEFMVQVSFLDARIVCLNAFSARKNR